MRKKLTARELIDDACDDMLDSFGKDSRLIKEFIHAREADPDLSMTEVIESNSNVKYAKKDRPD